MVLRDRGTFFASSVPRSGALLHGETEEARCPGDQLTPSYSFMSHFRRIPADAVQWPSLVCIQDIAVSEKGLED